MKRHVRVFVISAYTLFFFLFGNGLYAQEDISTVWYFDQTTFNSMGFTARTTFPVLRTADANLALSNTGLSQAFTTHPLSQPVTAAPFNSTSSTTTAEVLEFLRDDPWAVQNRGEADIVIMVVSDIAPTTNNNGTSNDPCGSAWTPPLLMGSQYRNTHAFAMVVTSTNCDDDIDLTVPHELGHVIYAEHEVGVLEDNQDPLLPDPFNHGHKGGTSGSTVMVSSGQPIMLARFSMGDSTFANVEDFWTRTVTGSSKTPWDIVAAYRSAPLQACNIDWELQFCHEGNIVVAVTALLPGYEILNMDYDVSFGGGPWEDLLEGARICPALIPQFATVARAILETPVGYSTCEVTVPIPTCPGDGPPWP